MLLFLKATHLVDSVAKPSTPPSSPPTAWVWGHLLQSLAPANPLLAAIFPGSKIDEIERVGIQNPFRVGDVLYYNLFYRNISIWNERLAKSPQMQTFLLNGGGYYINEDALG